MDDGNLMGYAYLVFPRRLCRVNLKELSSGKQPPMEVVADFQKLGLPVGMGAFMLESKLYMTGGEKVLKNINLRQRYHPDQILDVSGGDEGLNNFVFVFDPYNLDTPFSQIHDIPPMLHPKPNAKVANIDGIIYVLASKPEYFGKYSLPPPIFECYHPSRRSWEVLPQPPWYLDPDSEKLCLFIYFDVLLKKIHVRTLWGSFFYDVDRREWHPVDSFFISSGFDLDAPLPFLGHHSAAACVEGFAGFVISLTPRGVTAFQYAPDGMFRGYQMLDEINRSFIEPDDVGSGFVRYLGLGRFCFVSLQCDLHDDFFIAVSIYQMELINGADDKNDISLSVKRLHYHAYDFASIIFDYGLPSNVVIM